MSRQVLPFDDTAERAVIGCCILSPAAAETSVDLIGPGEFHDPLHQRLFAEIVAQVRVGSGRVDMIKIAANVGNNNEHLPYLNELQNDFPIVSNVAHYAEVIAGHHLRREAIRLASQISGEAFECAMEPADLAQHAREVFADLDMPNRVGLPDMDVDAFMASVDTSYDWLIPDLLERRDRMLVTAGEGTGKSVFLRQIAIQTAAGIHPWTGQMMTPRNVLVVDCENSTRQVSRAFDGLRKQAGQHLDASRLRIHCRPQGLDLTNRQDRRWLLERCISNRAELLVIGPLYRMHAGVSAKGDIGGEDAARKVTAALDDIRIRTNVALLMETHAPHGDGMVRDLRPFGSSVWLRWPEFGVGIRLDPEVDDPNRYVLKHWRGPRDVRLWPRLLMKNAGRWPWTPDGMPIGTTTTRSA